MGPSASLRSIEASASPRENTGTLLRPYRYRRTVKIQLKGPVFQEFCKRSRPKTVLSWLALVTTFGGSSSLAPMMLFPAKEMLFNLSFHPCTHLRRAIGLPKAL